MLKEKFLSEKDLYAELPEILAGKKPGRQSDRERIFIRAIGLVNQDIAMADHIYRARVGDRHRNAAAVLRTSAFISPDIVIELFSIEGENSTQVRTRQSDHFTSYAGAGLFIQPQFTQVPDLFRDTLFSLSRQRSDFLQKHTVLRCNRKGQLS